MTFLSCSTVCLSLPEGFSSIWVSTLCFHLSGNVSELWLLRHHGPCAGAEGCAGTNYSVHTFLRKILELAAKCPQALGFFCQFKALSSSDKAAGRGKFCYPVTTIPHPWVGLKAVGMWHLGTWDGGGLGSAGETLDLIWEAFSNLSDSTSSLFWGDWVGFGCRKKQNPKTEVYFCCSVPCWLGPAFCGYFTFLLAEARASCGQ